MRFGHRFTYQAQARGKFTNVRVGTVLLTVANQERAKKGLSNDQAHDTTPAIKAALGAIRKLITT